jgi:Domain of Unknown Function (DUF1080)
MRPLLWLKRSVQGCLFLLPALLIASCAAPKAIEQDAQRAPDPLTGDWEGHRVTPPGVVEPLKAQIIALGKNEFAAFLRNPAQEPTPAPVRLNLRFDGENLVSAEAPTKTARLSGDMIDGQYPGSEAGSLFLRKHPHLSPTLGAKAPQSAIVLFDGSLDGWTIVGDSGKSPRWTLVDNGAMEVVDGSGSIMTKRSFTDFNLHLEFRTPYMPGSRGQDRGNSGVYLQGRYEVQVLDSYALAGEDNECGGIYKVARPLINMCAPPGQWQTYDIMFRAPRFDSAGNKSSDALVTVLHNGVHIHKDLPIPGPTGGAVNDKVHLPGPLYLQDHGNPVQYRNIWVVETTHPGGPPSR